MEKLNHIPFSFNFSQVQFQANTKHCKTKQTAQQNISQHICSCFQVILNHFKSLQWDQIKVLLQLIPCRVSRVLKYRFPKFSADIRDRHQDKSYILGRKIVSSCSSRSTFNSLRKQKNKQKENLTVSYDSAAELLQWLIILFCKEEANVLRAMYIWQKHMKPVARLIERNGSWHPDGKDWFLHLSLPLGIFGYFNKLSELLPANTDHHGFCFKTPSTHKDPLC